VDGLEFVVSEWSQTASTKGLGQVLPVNLLNRPGILYGLAVIDSFGESPVVRNGVGPGVIWGIDEIWAGSAELNQPRKNSTEPPKSLLSYSYLSDK
jgi:hypothetical protein